MTKPAEPDVSVIVAAYNATGMIGEAVRTALAQEVTCQVIVIDDASTDETAAEARSVDDGSGRLIVETLPENGGPSTARNRALDLVTGDWVTILDADDRMEPGRLLALRDIACKKNWDMVADDIIRLSSWSEGAPRCRLWKDEDFGEVELSLARFVRENDPAHAGNGRELGFLKPLIRRVFLDQHALRYVPALRMGEDFTLYAHALILGARFGLVDPKGYLAFDRPGSLSKTHSAAVLEGLYHSTKALLTVPGLDAEGRGALRNHVLREHIRWAWMRQIEAVRRQDWLDFLKAYLAPPEVVLALLHRAILRK